MVVESSGEWFPPWLGVEGANVLCCPLLSGAAGAGLRPAAVQSFYGHLEELQAASSLPRLGPAHDIASGHQTFQDVHLKSSKSQQLLLLQPHSLLMLHHIAKTLSYLTVCWQTKSSPFTPTTGVPLVDLQLINVSLTVLQN